jgi:hypothetical protein
MNNFPKFLVFRFAPGSGGNFLNSLLQCSTGVGHWNADIEHTKPNSDWIKWFDQSFDKNLKQWLNHEPVANHMLGTREIFSAWYPRGNDLSPQEFFKLESSRCTPYYFHIKNKNSYIPVFWHKNHFPSYFQNSVFINIMLDSASLKWFDRSWYYKHHKVEFDPAIKQYVVTRLRHRASIQPLGVKFNNEYQTVYPNFRALAKGEIYKNPWRNYYQDQNFLKSSSGGRPNYTLTLSNLLDCNQCIDQYKKICNFLNIDALDQALVRELFLLWRERHAY